MKRLLVSAAVLGLVSATAAQAGPPTSSTATANATIVSTITLTKRADMSFGTLASPVGVTTVSVSSTGVLTGNPANIQVPGSSGGSPAKFDVGGDTSFTYNVAITDPSSTISLIDQNTNGGAAMSAVLAIVGAATGRTVTSAAADDVIITGTLTVGANQTPSVYQGTMHVQVAYD